MLFQKSWSNHTPRGAGPPRCCCYGCASKSFPEGSTSQPCMSAWPCWCVASLQGPADTRASQGAQPRTFPTYPGLLLGAWSCFSGPEMMTADWAVEGSIPLRTSLLMPSCPSSRPTSSAYYSPFYLISQHGYCSSLSLSRVPGVSKIQLDFRTEAVTTMPGSQRRSRHFLSSGLLLQQCLLYWTNRGELEHEPWGSRGYCPFFSVLL